MNGGMNSGRVRWRRRSQLRKTDTPGWRSLFQDGKIQAEESSLAATDIS
jgi:hypothetical protein